MRTLKVAALGLAFVTASAATAFAFHPRHGMPREPRSVAAQCAKANGGVHIPYRGWRTRDLYGYRMCMWEFWMAAHRY